MDTFWSTDTLMGFSSKEGSFSYHSLNLICTGWLVIVQLLNLPFLSLSNSLFHPVVRTGPIQVPIHDAMRHFCHCNHSLLSQLHCCICLIFKTFRLLEWIGYTKNIYKKVIDTAVNLVALFFYSDIHPDFISWLLAIKQVLNNLHMIIY